MCVSNENAVDNPRYPLEILVYAFHNVDYQDGDAGAVEVGFKKGTHRT